MTDKKRTYITTALPYANGELHLGHLFEIVFGDVLAKSLRWNCGHEVRFNTGLDQNGGKIADAARQAYPDLDFQKAIYNFNNDAVESFYKFARRWSIEVPYDRHEVNFESPDYGEEANRKNILAQGSSFYFTAFGFHDLQVKEIFKQLCDEGFFKIEDYKGTYCQGCESFKLDRDLVDGKCPDHPNLELVEVSEPNYFFRPTDNPLEHLEIIPKRLTPEAEKSVGNAISVSRLHQPESNLIQSHDPEHDIYVWVDALSNYILTLGYGSSLFDESFQRWWHDAQTVQICGPDNIKFQACVFQHLLHALGLPYTDKLLVHGMIKDKDGQKLSKTLGNYVSLNELSKKYGSAPVRLYIAAGLSTYTNSNWDEADLVSLFNSRLANGLGNNARRATTLLLKYGGEDILRYSEEKLAESDTDFVKEVNALEEKAKTSFESFDVNDGFLQVHNITNLTSKYLDEKKPWSKELDDDDRRAILADVWFACKKVLRLYRPILFETKFGEIEQHTTFQELYEDQLIFNDIWFKRIEE